MADSGENQNSGGGQQTPSGGQQSGSPRAPQGLIGQAGVKPSGWVERSGTVPETKIVRDTRKS